MVLIKHLIMLGYRNWKLVAENRELDDRPGHNPNCRADDDGMYNSEVGLKKCQIEKQLYNFINFL